MENDPFFAKTGSGQNTQGKLTIRPTFSLSQAMRSASRTARLAVKIFSVRVPADCRAPAGGLQQPSLMAKLLLAVAVVMVVRSPRRCARRTEARGGSSGRCETQNRFRRSFLMKTKDRLGTKRSFVPRQVALAQWSYTAGIGLTILCPWLNMAFTTLVRTVPYRT